MENNTFYDVNDIMTICGCKQSKAYSVIRELNSELASKGFLTFQGKVSRQYFKERLYGGVPSNLQEEHYGTSRKQQLCEIKQKYMRWGMVHRTLHTSLVYSLHSQG